MPAENNRSIKLKDHPAFLKKINNIKTNIL